jgi:hypothetical protein
MKDNVLHIVRHTDNAITIVPRDGGVEFSVAEEHAMDSYN